MRITWVYAHGSVETKFKCGCSEPSPFPPHCLQHSTKSPSISMPHGFKAKGVPTVTAPVSSESKVLLYLAQTVRAVGWASVSVLLGHVVGTPSLWGLRSTTD